MTDTQMLVGSLSNDLFRVASLTKRGSNKAASRFFKEAIRWAEPLQKSDVADYIVSIASDVCFEKDTNVSMEKAEKYLMYGVLLQNYALHRGEVKIL